jgi:DNA polymerase III subunit gamma/tau
MGKALYRKYRSKKLSEIIGQEHITDTLSNALKTGNISHAYLFTGPRGVGKTSIARILAHEVNGLSYDEESNHLDIIEIDAASNRRIDEIRELRERIHTAPAVAKYKVYIIDEVHMLTKEAFNALLKTLEEPPAHAIFILATTESHKLPETIISRTQRFAFKPIDRVKAVAHLRTIADHEGISISDDALDLIAEHGSGSFRDSISLLDQISATGGNIELTQVQTMLGIAPQEIIEKLLAVLESGTASELANILQQIRDQGISPVKVAKQLGALIREKLLEDKLSFSPAEIGIVLNDLLFVASSHDPEASLEIALISIVLKRKEPHIESQATTELKTKVQPTKPSKDEKADSKTDLVTTLNEAATPKPEPAPLDTPLDDEVWQKVLDALKKKHNTLYGIIRMARTSIEKDEVILKFKFAFHQKRINESKNKQVLVDILQDITGKPVRINCVLDKNLDSETQEPPETKSQPADSEALDTISNIFGPSEVIE